MANELSLFSGLSDPVGIGSSRIGGPGLPASGTFFSNLTAANSAIFRAAMQDAIDGSDDCSINCIGDSIVAGFGSDPANGGTGIRHRKAWPYVAAGLLRALFPTANVHRQGVWGNAGKTAINYTPYNAEFALNSATVSTVFSVGGTQWTHNAITGAMRWTPTEDTPFDRVHVAWADRFPAANLVRWTTNTAETGTFVGTQSELWVDTTLSLVTPATWIEFRANSAGVPIAITGIECYNAASNYLFFRNCGWGGSRAFGTGTNSWTGGASLNYSPQNGQRKMAQLAHGLHIIGLGTNDATNGTAQADFDGAMDTIITRATGAGDCDALVLTFPPIDPVMASQSAQNLIADRVRAAALRNNVTLLDINKLFGNGIWSEANAAGLMYDWGHPNEAGYVLIAQQVVKTIQAMVAA